MSAVELIIVKIYAKLFIAVSYIFLFFCCRFDLTNKDEYIKMHGWYPDKSP